MWTRGSGGKLAPIPASEVVASVRAVAARSQLDGKQEKKLRWWIDRLKADAFVGDQIPKDRIPGALATRNGLSAPLANAWRFELPGAYRGIYTLDSGEGRRPAVVILEILSHKEYDRLFGYR